MWRFYVFFLCVLIFLKQNIVDAKLHAFSMSVPSSSPWAWPLPASFCLNSVKTTSIHFSSYLFNVSTLCNSSDDRIPNEVTMVLMHFFVIILLWSNWGSINFLKCLLSKSLPKTDRIFLFFFKKFVFYTPSSAGWEIHLFCVTFQGFQ